MITVAYIATVSSMSWAQPQQETMLVIGQQQEDIEFQLLEEELEQVAGGTNLIETSSLGGSQSSLAKVLNQQIGIVVQEFFGGNDQPRINIRGSGIQDNPVNRGIQLLNDGLALNQADGSFIIGLVDPEQANLISVYRGANGMRYGATTLGGAINFHNKTGKNATSQVQLELGSYGLYKATGMLAQQIGNWDYFLSSSHSQQEGYRNNSEAQRQNIAFNLGYTGTDWDNRTYLSFTDNNFNIPFLLTKERAKLTSNQVMGEGNEPMDKLLNIPIRKPFRHTKQLRIANKTEWLSKITTQKLGFYFESLEDQFRDPLTQANTSHGNIGMDYSAEWDIFTDDYYQRNYLFFMSANTGNMQRKINSVHPVTSKLMSAFAQMDLQASNAVLGGQIRYELLRDLQVLASLQLVHNERKITDKMNPGVLDSLFTYQILNPKFGFIYQLAEQTRLYANLSGSSESPNFWQLATVSANPTDPLNNHVYINALEAQTALTGEIGTEIKSENLNISASWYTSAVKNELISVVGDFAVNGKTINYQGNTIHHGLEVAVKHQSTDWLMKEDQLSAQLLYNWSNFYFKDGLYQHNQIAGVPVHLIQGQVDYELSSGWRIIPNFTWQPTSTYTDHLNSDKNTQDPYFLLGVKLGYEIQKGPKIFFEVNNLTNTNYQSAYVIRGQGAPELPTFIPGPGINAIIGVTYTW